jgi:predicted MFS family arabinose efflux permease
LRGRIGPLFSLHAQTNLSARYYSRNTREMLIMNKALAVLTFGNFAVGSGALVTIGLLDVIAKDLNVSISAAGQLTTIFAITIAFAGPILATLTSSVDRRTLLLVALGIFSLGHFGSAIAGSYQSLMMWRVVAALGACLYTPHAATSATMMVEPAQRGRAIATVFGGFILATVFGVPGGTWLGAISGWRTAMIVIAVLPLIAALFVWRTLPNTLRVPPVDGAAWGKLLSNSTLLLLLATTLLQVTGQLVLFAYIAPMLKQSLAVSSAAVAWIFMWYGAANVVGNALVARSIDRIGADRMATFAIVGVVLALALISFANGSLIATLALLALWGATSFAINSAMQVRLVGTAPALATVSLPMNSSAIYAGQALGAAIGGVLVAQGHLLELGWPGAAITAVALLTSWIAWRMALAARRTSA